MADLCLRQGVRLKQSNDLCDDQFIQLGIAVLTALIELIAL